MLVRCAQAIDALFRHSPRRLPLARLRSLRPSMRLTAQQIETIRSTALQVTGPGGSVWVYGSRLDDARRGGDLDLLVQSDPPIDLLQRARIKNALERQLNMPVDVLATASVIDAEKSAFVAIAKANAQRL